MSSGTTAHSVVEPSAWSKRIAGALVLLYALITIVPLVWIFMTGFKTPQDSISYPPKVVFEPSLEGYVNLFTTRTRQTPEYMAQLPPPDTWYDELVRSRNMVIAGPSKFGERFMNSVIIGFGSTFLSVFLGTLAAYAFSRFKIPLKDDLLFFILSTRMMPPIAVAIPIFLMYRQLGLSDTHLGMILLYTAVNISLAVESRIMPRWVSDRPSWRYIRKIGIATAIGGIIRVDRMKNSRSSFSGILNRENA